MIIIFWACSPISFKHMMSFWYPFLGPHLATYHSNIGVWWRLGIDSGTSTFCAILCGEINVSGTPWYHQGPHKLAHNLNRESPVLWWYTLFHMIFRKYMLRFGGLIRLLILNGHLYLSGVWLGVDLRMDIKKACVKKKLDDMHKIHWPLNSGPIWSYNKKENHHFKNE